MRRIAPRPRLSRCSSRRRSILLAFASMTLFIVHAPLARTLNQGHQEQLGAEIFQGAPGKVLLRMIGTRFSSDP